MKIEIRPLSKADDKAIYDTLKIHFRELYDFMGSKGLVMPLADNGPQIWMNAIRSTLGKLSNIFIAYDGHAVIGFVTGIIRLSPAYLGNKKIGYLSHLFIHPDYRRTGTGEKLSQRLDQWFEEKNVDIVEVEVIVHNTHSIDFFKKVGYKEDILKLTKNAKI